MEEAKVQQRWVVVGLLLIGLSVFSVQFYERYIILRTVVLSFSLGLFLAIRVLKKVRVNLISLILFFLFLLEIISACWSYSVGNTIKYTHLALLCFLFFLLFSQEGRYSNIWILSRLNALLITVYIVVAFYQVFTKGWGPYGIYSLSAHKNLFAGLLMLSLPVTIISIKYFRKRAIIILLKAILTLSLLLIVILQSRSVYLAMLLFFFITLVFGGYYFLKSSYRKKIVEFVRQLIWIPVIIIPGVFLYLLVIDSETKEDFMDKINLTNYFSEPQNEEISNITENNYRSIEIRKIFWTSSLKLISDRPFLGVGRGNWKIAVGEYASPHIPDRLADSNSYSHAHNDFLQQCSETGIPGFLLLFSPILLLIGIGYKSIVAGAFSLEVFFITIGLTAFLVVAFFDFPFQNVEHRVYFYFQMLILYQSLVANGTVNPKRTFSVNKTLLYIPITAAFILSIIQLRSDFHALKAVQFEGEGDYTSAIAHLNRAKSPIYDITPSNFPLDYISGRIYIETGNYEKAFPLVKASLEVNPFEFRALNDYGMLLHVKGRTQESLQAFQKAIDIAPYFEEPKYNMAAIYYIEKRYDLALKILETAGESEKKNTYIRQIKAEMNQFKE